MTQDANIELRTVDEIKATAEASISAGLAALTATIRAEDEGRLQKIPLVTQTGDSVHDYSTKS